MPRAEILAPPAPLDGVVDPDHYWTIRRKPIDDEGKELAGNEAAVPAGAAQDMVVKREIGSFPKAHGAQSRSYSALASSKSGSSDKNQNMIPDRGGE
jgi:hypothetical protein